MERVLTSSHPGSRARRHKARTLLSLVALVSVVPITLLTFTPAASSQEDPAAPARDRLARAQADAVTAQSRYDQAVADRDQAQTAVAELVQAVATARAEEAAVRQEIANRAVVLYKNADDASGLGMLDNTDPMDAGRKTKFTEVTDKYYKERVGQLHDAADRQQQAQDELQKKRDDLGDRIPELQKEKEDADAKVLKAQRGIQIAEALAPLQAAGDPIMGPTVLNAGEMAAWLRSSGASPRLSAGVTVEQIAQMYVDEGNAENVRGDVAFAQANIETGGFSAGGSDNNFSGLGACNGCGGQNRFPTALDGIRAQIQLLKAYAGGGPLVNPPSPYWWGPDGASAYDRFGGRGSAPTWHQMGGGKWASDGGYSGKVLGAYDKMIASAEGT
jgi:Mannosyl-glycoprotein endo-beta-N-acetylglucosaminidase